MSSEPAASDHEAEVYFLGTESLGNGRIACCRLRDAQNGALPYLKCLFFLEKLGVWNSERMRRLDVRFWPFYGVPISFREHVGEIEPEDVDVVFYRRFAAAIDSGGIPGLLEETQNFLAETLRRAVDEARRQECTPEDAEESRAGHPPKVYMDRNSLVSRPRWVQLSA